VKGRLRNAQKCGAQMQYAWSFPMIAVAGFFWLTAEKPATETRYCPIACSRELILDGQTPLSDVPGWGPLKAINNGFALVYGLQSRPLLPRFNRSTPSEDPNSVMENGVLQTFNDDEADLYKRLNRRPDVRRKERKVRSAWLDWFLGWCLDLVAVLAAAEISASIVVRAL
jgi:hypothetical protein